MAERRRRRLVTDESELSDGSGGEAVVEKGSDLESEGERTVAVEGMKEAGASEYESAEDEDVVASESQFQHEGEASTEQDSTTEFIDEGGMEDTADVVIEGELEQVHEEIFLDDFDEDDVDYVGERQEGDGEEGASPFQAVEKVLDDDEDRRNPQFIPKKGAFYEHDDRIHGEEETVEKKKPEEEIKTDNKKKKKLWLDEEKWDHDMFHEEEQAPKSHEEVVAVYGYDIRSEDGPPRARRRRRYGRGPNKYTRNWQDEDAYVTGLVSERGNRGRRRGRGRGRGQRQYQDGSFMHENKEVRGNRKSSKDASDSLINTEDFPSLPSQQHMDQNTYKNESDVVVNNSASKDSEVVQSLTFENSKYVNKYKATDKEEERHLKGQGYSSRTPRGKKPPFPTVSRGHGRGQRKLERTFSNPTNSVNSTANAKSTSRSRQRTSSSTDDSLESGVIGEIEKLEIGEPRVKENQMNFKDKIPRKDGRRENHKTNSQSSLGNAHQREHVSGGHGDVQNTNRPKRYSSLRQRSLPENSNYQPAQPSVPPRFYETGYRPVYAANDGVTRGTQHQQPTSPPLLAAGHFQGYTATTPYQEGYGGAVRAPIPNLPRILPSVSMTSGQPVVPNAYLPANSGLINYPTTPVAPSQPPAAPPAGFPQYPLPQQYNSPPPPPPELLQGIPVGGQERTTDESQEEEHVSDVEPLTLGKEKQEAMPADVNLQSTVGVES
ncbi:CASC3 exon junction complex subunit isoform X3 [Tachypleus tridentatus]|uniref:CASC3 exon junction complex subunit isoform X3 n=1 Tax=Tachypleus tridentatus TaxID=6853 RepID=UPI003FD2B499